jgi:hypothetical protein
MVLCYTLYLEKNFVVVTKKSQHIEFWKSCLPVLSSMYFTEENSDVQLRPPCLKNWIASVRGMIHITGKLFENNFRIFLPAASIKTQ